MGKVKWTASTNKSRGTGVLGVVPLGASSKGKYTYMISLHKLLSVLAIGAMLCACSSAQNELSVEKDKPNVVLILIDDMGFNDLGVNGNNAVATPNLDALAAQGVRFTRHYVDSTCSPTRVGILTGAEPIKQGFTPAGRGISPELVTLPEALQTAGYMTHHIGKWHVGHTTKLAWPNQQGFDTFFGFLNQFLLRGPQQDGEFNYKRPTYHNPWLQEQNERPRQHIGELSEILTRRAIELIDSKKEEDQPWFLNLWTYAPHAPIQPMSEFAGKYPNTPQGRYTALLEQVDDTVGRVVESLERNNLTDNTLLIVASDNGGTNKQIDNNAPYFGTKATFFEGGVRTPLLIRWPGHFHEGLVFKKSVSNFDYFPTIAKATGAKLPPKLPGRDLQWVVRNNVGLDTPLFWEAGNSKVHAWSALSSGGRWRMSQYFFGEPVLNDLNTNPSGELDVLKDNQPTGQMLHKEYLTWRHNARLVPVDYSRSAANGRAQLSGSSMQRSPGFGGHTFAIAVTPDRPEEPAADLNAAQKQFIAYHEGQWNISFDGSKLTAVLNGTTIEGGALPYGQCSTVALTSHFVFSALKPKVNRAQIQLYVNERLVGSKHIEHPILLSDNLMQPTYIGGNASGQYRFSGILGRPLIYSERLVGDSEKNTTVDNGIARVTRKLCKEI
ncbi:MAG: arylsulfatase A-like enzyme [Halioglobus sp.]